MLTICSCSLFDNKEDTTGVGAFETAIANTNASNVKVKSEVETAIGKLTSEFSISYKADGSATIEYKYEKFNLIGEGAENEEKSVITGKVTRAADGTYSGDMPEGVDLSSVAASAALNLAPIKDSAVVSEVGDVLNVTVPAAKSAEVFGSALSYDAELEISIKNGVVTFIEITFESGKITYQYA